MSQETMWSKVLELVEHSTLPEKSHEVFLFGAGLVGMLTIPLLRNKLNLVAICDNDKKKQGTKMEGLTCIAPQKLKQYQNPFVLISSCKCYRSIHKELEKKNIPHCNLDSYVIHQNLDAFQEVFQSLDKESRRVYAGILCCRLLGDSSKITEYCCENQYFAFPRFRYGNVGGICIDCGAYTGDILQKVVENSLGAVQKIYAFEPGKRAYAALQKRAAFLRDIWALEEEQIICEQKGVGEKNYRAAVSESRTNLANTVVSLTRNGEDSVEIVALDDYLAGKNVENVTFIKADIEGFEWDMLRGAARTIQRNKPNLAISIYHSIFDYFRIFKYLKELVPEYDFAVRHHWNSFDETVLYCYIKEER